MDGRIRLHRLARKRVGWPSARTSHGAWLLALVAVACGAGCQFSSNRGAGTAVGGGLGAVTGAIIGEGSGHPVAGAVVGALTGGAIGGLAGHAEDMREERDAAIAHAQYLESTRQYLTNGDVIRMTQSGLSDDVIIGTIRQSYGRYELGPNEVIQLRTYGVSDRVIIALQQVPRSPQVAPVAYMPPPPPSVGVVVAPPPVMVYGGPRYYRGPHYGPRRW